MDDFIGKKIGWLTVLKEGEPYFNKTNNNKTKRYTVICRCGNIKDMTKSVLLKESTKSCGCYSAKLASENGKKNKTHGMTKTPTYKSWISMKSRCYNKNSPSYKYYGAIGIYVCDRWVNSFENFLEDMGERPSGKTLERIDNDCGYFEENCKWATYKEQARNRKSNKLSAIDVNKIRDLINENMNLNDIAKTYNVTYGYILRISKYELWDDI